MNAVITYLQQYGAGLAAYVLTLVVIIALGIWWADGYDKRDEYK